MAELRAGVVTFLFTDIDRASREAPGKGEPAGATKLWADIDQDITDKAALVPLFSQYGADFVSKRVGNYQYNPQWGALLSQMWVR